jgi:hypothetical protein
MSPFKPGDATPRAILWSDDRFHIVIRRSSPPPMSTAQLVIHIYPITDGEVWDEAYQVFVVDEGRVIELENQFRKE